MSKLGSAILIAAGLLVTPAFAQSPATVLPTPPEGYRWVQNDAFSDEFDGTKLDSNKWHDHNPKWQGRPPGLFVPESVNVKDGFLQIRSTKLAKPQGEFTIACGAVQSKAQNALYGYYECRMKASSISTSSTFWLTGGEKRVKDGRIRLELDIQECIGNAQRFAGFKEQMKGNTHIKFTPDKKGDHGDQHGGAKGGNINLKSNVDHEFHTYGCWWIDANTMKFYADGNYGFTIEPTVEFDPHPFDQPLFMNLVCETYAWEVPPTDEDLADDNRNTTYYDYVRSYKLAKSN